MSREVLVPLLKAVVLLDVVEVVPSDHHRPLHLHAPYHPRQYPASDADVARERTLLVNVGAFNSLVWGREREGKREGMREGRKEGGWEGRREGRKEGGKEGRGRRVSRKEGREGSGREREARREQANEELLTILCGTPLGLMSHGV